MIAVLIAVATAFTVGVFGTPFVIRYLQRHNIGAQIRDDGPVAHPHEAKAGTPTMGGVAIVGAAFVGYLVAHINSEAIKFADTAITLWVLILGLFAVGFVDDYLGVKRARNLGLRKRGKTVGLVMVATVFAVMSVHVVKVSTDMSFTRAISGMDLGTVGWILWAIAVVYAMTNAVNITDGLDGLAAGSSALVFAAFVVISFTQFRHEDVYLLRDATLPALRAGSIDVTVVAAAMMGACVGFLWWNAPPAKVFMGDTGALALGGAMAGMGLLTNTALLLPIIGGLYVLETASVVAQVISFRGFGRRILRMSPIHHHFELLGWPESTIIVRFWILAGLAMALGLGLFYADFLRIPGAGG
ncbi:MAG: phospho-N-acetylmuramoyl-pentapeptide-transferase [Acidimicrobiia bacterium]|nr:phospho-N-acetylmuramoyl-pentapeptide-transferase [Acidimicrobiia bacterium]